MAEPTVKQIQEPPEFGHLLCMKQVNGRDSLKQYQTPLGIRCTFTVFPSGRNSCRSWYYLFSRLQLANEKDVSYTNANAKRKTLWNDADP